MKLVLQVILGLKDLPAQQDQLDLLEKLVHKDQLVLLDQLDRKVR